MDRVIICGGLVIECLLGLLCLKYAFSKRKYMRWGAIVCFAIYFCGFLYFTFFSREAEQETFAMLQPLRAYKLAFTFDSGFLHVIKQIFTEGPRVGFDSIHIESTETLEGIILNILLFVPFGYMLPCIFRKMQKALWGVVLIGFVCSLLTETVQLVTNLGWFDLDDLLNNTIGCIVGVVFYGVFLRERKMEVSEEAAT
ncbi:MAG: VanZ family protein [Lachnospiraceae bacterium]|nr:VanZ family protein [Lachnospiraceae bacterium]